MKRRSFRGLRLGAGPLPRPPSIRAEHASAQNRAAPRHVRPLRRHHRTGQRDRPRRWRRRISAASARRKIEIIAADNLNKADLREHRPRQSLDNQGVDMILDVRASADTPWSAGRDREGAQQDRDVQRPRLDPPQQRGLRAINACTMPTITFAQALMQRG